jgi:hypothetical protein
MTALRIREYSIDGFICSLKLCIIATRLIVILVELGVVVPIENFIAVLKRVTPFNLYKMKFDVFISILSFVRSRGLRSISSLWTLITPPFVPAARIK